MPAPPTAPFAGVSGPPTVLEVRAGDTVQIPVQTWSTGPVPEGILTLSGSLTTAPLDYVVNGQTTQAFTVSVPASAQGGEYFTLDLSEYVPGRVDTFTWNVALIVHP